MHIPSTLAKNALGPLTDPGLLTPLSPIHTYLQISALQPPGGGGQFIILVTIIYDVEAGPPNDADMTESAAQAGQVSGAKMWKPWTQRSVENRHEQHEMD